METEDIIELGSSDEEPGPPPPKKMKVRNAMVHIPSKLHGVTIKPVNANIAQLPKLGKNITITKTTGSKQGASVPINRGRLDKVVQKPIPIKKKIIGKKPNQVSPTKGKLYNPLSNISKPAMPSVGSPTITRLKHPIVIKKPVLNRPQPLQKLPPSIIIKKTVPVVKPHPNIILPPKTLSKQITNISKKRKIEVVQTVELDDDEASTSSASPQWYVRPEDQSQSTQNAVPSTQEEAGSKEGSNNTEPEGPKYIEITIEDSPVKPAKTKRTRELSTEKVITIDDSPNKGSVISDDAAGDIGSDVETNTTKKVPHSKKKLNYPTNLQAIKETHTLEIEFEPIELMEQIDPLKKDASNIEVNNDKVISLTPEIMNVEEASVEIAQNKQGAISVVQLNPVQPKQNSKATPKKDVAMKSEFHPIYQNFISLCIQLENSNDMEKIIEKKIKPYYRQVPKEYVESEEFLDMVSSKITAMEAAPEKMYLYIKDIVDELNLQRKYIKQVPAEETKSNDQDSFIYGKENELDPNKQRQIRKLEKTLKKLNRAIQKLEAQEVDFDDEEDSVYLLTEKYKERMVRVHAKFCQLTNTKLPSQPRLVIDPRPGLSAAPAKRLEAFINKKNALQFPDFHDVLRCVREANEMEKLGWNEACIMEEARDLFVRCGRKLQRRRQENEWRLATSRITASSDPAEQSVDLQKQLDANRRLASTKEIEVINKFCDRQSQLKLEAEEIDDKDAEESPAESEEEDNDEDSSLQSKQRRKNRLRRLLQEQSKKNTSDNLNKEKQCAVETIESLAEKKSETENEEDKIQSLSDDSNEICSDMDELHLLQKLHSDCEIRTVSSSSDSETPIAISDTLDSSSDDEKKPIKQENDVISIENSSYSDESDPENSKNNKKDTVASGDVEGSHAIEDSSSVDKATHIYAVTIENTVLNSSEDDGSNSNDNTNSLKSDKSSNVSFSKDGQVSSVKDEDLSIRSESAELCINLNDVVKPSDAEDEQSTISDIIDNPGSSASSGQYEELLKEHNSDPLLKRPDLIPRDPSDALYDSLVIKHYNDPLVKKHLKGSDSPDREDPENSNSDTQSTIPPETPEELQKDLIESSVDTEELLNLNSPSSQIVDRFVEKLKQSDGSQSSDDLMMKVDQELGLRPDVMSPVTFALEKEVNLARQTKPWPRFKDECSSLSSADDENTGDNSQSMPTKTRESKTEDFDGIETAPAESIASIEEKGSSTGTSESTKIESESKISNPKDTGVCSTSIKKISEKRNVAHEEKAPKKDLTDKHAVTSECMTDVSDSMDVDHVKLHDSDVAYACTSERLKDGSDGMDVAYSEETLIKGISACSSGSKDVSAEFNPEANSCFSTASTTHVSQSMEQTEIVPALTGANNIVTRNNEQTEEIGSEELINRIVSLESANDKDQTFQENSSAPGKTIMKKLNSNNESENHNGDGIDESKSIGNGSVKIMDITDLLDSNTNLSQKPDDLDQIRSAEKEDSEKAAVPRTVSSVCLQSTEGNN